MPTPDPPGPLGPDEEFLTLLIREGRVVFRRKPDPVPGPPSGAAGVLAEAFRAYRLAVAGPEIPFEAGVACEAAEFLTQSCWALVSRGERPGALAQRLRMSRAPACPGDHLSADLTLRHLPQVYRRARALDPSDPLVAILAGVLRQWPLSGVLAGLDDGPEVAPDFGGHPGLLLLYAERLAGHDRPAWRPGGGGPDYLELVRGEVAP